MTLTYIHHKISHQNRDFTNTKRKYNTMDNRTSGFATEVHDLTEDDLKYLARDLILFKLGKCKLFVYVAQLTRNLSILSTFEV